jgi:septal ring factor EnvC (AmiA/AmiB activator)
MTVTVSDRQSSQVDRRREKAASTATAVEKAQAGVTELDNRLQTNSSLTQQHKQALRNAEAEANRLRRSLKAALKERDKLSKARKKAVAKADKARSKAKAAEAKYEKSVLADMVNREKIKDRAGSARPPVESRAAGGSGPVESTAAAGSGPVASTAAAGSGPVASTAAPGSGPAASTATADPPPEHSDPGTTTATQTAANKTATAAGVHAPDSTGTS